MGSRSQRRRPGSPRCRVWVAITLLALVAGMAAATPAGAAAARVRGWADRFDAGLAASLRATEKERDHATSPGSLPFDTAAHAAASGPLGVDFGFGSALIGAAPTQPGPSLLAVDPATHTVYVVNGDNADGPNQGGDTVSVIDTRHCSAADVSRCRGPWPTVTVGYDPTSVAVDRATDTVYVTNGGDFSDPGTVSVFNGATCNAADMGGCGQTPREVPVGVIPVGIYADSANHTVYVPNAGDGTVSLINSATCNGTHLAGCPSRTAPTVTVGAGADDVDVDQATHTVYVAQSAGVAVFDADTCNATTNGGCATVATLTIPGGEQPFAVAADPANQTLYTANGDSTVSAFDLHDCNASDLNGCAAQTPGTVTVPDPGFDGALWVVIDRANGTVYVPFFHDDALMAFATSACDGANLARCATIVPKEIHTGTEPESVGLDPRTQTLYTGDEVDDDVSVIDARRCDAQTSVGCRPVPPTTAVPDTLNGIDDPAEHTLYEPSFSGDDVTLLDTRACNAAHPSACPATPVGFAAGVTPNDAILDPGTHTVYINNVDNFAGGSLSVVDDRTCNVTTQAGCRTAATLAVPAGLVPVAADLDQATDTLYVSAFGGSPMTGTSAELLVFNAATCNAENHSDCSPDPSAVPLGTGVSPGVSVNQATNTVYVASDPADNSAPGSVAVIDGATCNGTHPAGCAAPIGTITVGVAPQAVAVDEATNSVYTANDENGDYQGTVSIIDGATCVAGDAAGCDQTAATTTVGFGADGIAIDQTHNQVWVDNGQDASVSLIDGAQCNGGHEANCARPWPKLSVTDYPGTTVFADEVGTAYVSGNDLSIVRFAP
jgi:DNA-binding beta-propeller fold protein YncE